MRPYHPIRACIRLRSCDRCEPNTSFMSLSSCHKECPTTNNFETKYSSADCSKLSVNATLAQEQSLVFSQVAVTAPTYPRRNKQTYRNSLQPAIAELRKSRKSCDGVGPRNVSDWVGTGGMGKRSGHDLIRLNHLVYQRGFFV